MFRLAGKAFREMWALSCVIILVVANAQGLNDGTWVQTASNFASVLIFIWLILFAIGVSRGEPNP